MSKYTYVKFVNITDRDFLGIFDREPYIIKAGQSEYFPPFLAKHLAKRLADREMILDHGKPMTNEPIRNAFILKCLNMADEKSLERLEQMSLKSQIDQDRDELIKQGKIDAAIDTDLKNELLGDDVVEALEEAVPAKKQKIAKEDAVEFEGKTAGASSRLRRSIPEPKVD